MLALEIAFEKETATHWRIDDKDGLCFLWSCNLSTSGPNLVLSVIFIMMHFMQERLSVSTQAAVDMLALLHSLSAEGSMSTRAVIADMVASVRTSWLRSFNALKEVGCACLNSSCE